MSIFREWWLRRFRLEKNIWLLKLLMQLKSRRAADIVAAHWNAQVKYEEQYAAKLRGLGRLFLGYDGALDGWGLGRDSLEFVKKAEDAMIESFEFMQGRMSKRLLFIIVMNNAESFPLDYLKFRTMILMSEIKTAVRKWALPVLCATALVISLATNAYLLWGGAK